MPSEEHNDMKHKYETEDETDAEIDPDQFKDALKEYLDDFKQDGTFSAFHHYNNYVNPGLQLTDYGPVGLPLAPRDASSIARVCKQSPFGKGSDTVIDTSVRKTWELDASEFVCRNPSWESYVNSLVSQATKSLGIATTTHAVIYKLLLYEEGAFFKVHKDSEKIPGMYGTLVICLPSEHSGGEVHLSHGKDSRVYQTAPTSQFDLTTLAWYSDVKHEIKPVTSGYRLVLTYNLVQNQGGLAQSAAGLGKSYMQLEELLKAWPVDNIYPQYLLYPLEHQYTEASLSLSNLKGDDAARGRALEKVAAKSGVYCFIGGITNATKEDSYGYDDDDELGLSLDYVVTPAGKSINLCLELDQDSILADNLYSNRQPDSEDEGEWTGNEGMSSTYRYHDMVLILMRKEELFTAGRMHDFRDVGSLKALLELIQNDQTAPQEFLKKSIRWILSAIIAAIMSKCDRQTHVPYYESKESEVLGHLFDEISEQCLSEGRSDVVPDSLEVLRDKDWRSSPELVRIVAKQAAKEYSDGNVNAWEQWLSESSSKSTFKHVEKLNSSFKLIGEIIPKSLKKSFDDWRAKELDTMLRTIRTYSADDVKPAITLASSIESSQYFNLIVPKVIEWKKELLTQFLKLVPSSLNPSLTKTTYQRVIQQAAPTLQLTKSEFVTKTPQPHTDSYMHGLSKPEPLRPLEYPAVFFEILSNTLVYELFDEATLLLAKALPPIPAGSPFWAEWRPFFQFSEKLIRIVECYNNDEVNSVAVAFITSGLQNAVNAFAKTRPVEPREWMRAPILSDCTCAPCQKLNSFLRDSHQPVGRFSYALKIRNHLASRVSFMDMEYRTATDNSRSPHTLVITKIGHLHKKNVWQRDFTAMQAEFAKIQSPLLPPKFGETLFCPLKPSYCSPVAQPLQPLGSEAQNNRRTAPIAGTKRKADIVDLTGDASD